MNLFRNRNKKFEKKLKQQFEGLEYKPSELLWGKISDEIPEGNFEKTFAENVNSFEPKINPEIWNKIENQLPKHQRRNNYRLLWIPLLFLFFGSAAYFGYQMKESAANNQQLIVSNGEKSNEQFANDYKQVAISKKNLEVDNILKGNKQLAISKEKLEVGKEKKSNLIIASNNSKTSIQKDQNKQSKKVDSRKINTSNFIDESKKVVHQKSARSISNTVKSSGEKVDKDRNIKIEKSSVNAELSENNINAVKVDEKQNQTSTSSTYESKIETVSNNFIPKVDSAITLNTPPIRELKNIIADSISTNKSDATISKEEKLTKFSISIISGMNYCYNHLSAPSNSTLNFSENISLRKNIETPMMDWNGAFLLDYEIDAKWRISSGIMVSNFSQQFQYAIQTPTGNHAHITDPSARINNPNDSIVGGSAYNNRIKYTWTEIPIFITYSFPKKHKFGIELTAGISYAIISGVDAAYVSYDNVGVLVLTDKTGFPGVKNNFFFHLNPTVTYKLNELVQIGIAPTFKYSLTSITDNNNWVQQQPYFIGLAASLRKKF